MFGAGSFPCGCLALFYYGCLAFFFRSRFGFGLWWSFSSKGSEWSFLLLEGWSRVMGLSWEWRVGIGNGKGGGEVPRDG